MKTGESRGKRSEQTGRGNKRQYATDGRTKEINKKTQSHSGQASSPVQDNCGSGERGYDSGRCGKNTDSTKNSGYRENGRKTKFSGRSKSSDNHENKAKRWKETNYHRSAEPSNLSDGYEANSEQSNLSGHGERKSQQLKLSGNRGRNVGQTKFSGCHNTQHSRISGRLGRTAKEDFRESAEELCSVAKKCGGCRWINRPYEEQLKLKEKWVKELLSPYCKPEPIIGMENPAHYRNKVHAVFGEDRKHNPISGIYEKGTHYIVPVDSCMIENEKADEIIVSIRKLLPSFKIRPYNEDSGYGLFRHVLVRMGYATGEIMVVLVLSSPILPSKNNFTKALLKIHPEITTIVINVNNRSTSMVLGDKEQVIYGKGYIEDSLCGKIFRISPKSFYQVNPVQTEKLYRKALEYADLTGTEVVVDAYCGTGTIGLLASDKAAKVIGVELNADAVKDAGINARRNGVQNIQFYQNDAGQFLVEMAQQQEQVDVVLLDPPRAGCDETFLSSVAKIRPGKIVYISCNPETLVRDIKVLSKVGYEVKRGGAVDMFPFAEHVETAALLVRKP